MSSPRVTEEPRRGRGRKASLSRDLTLSILPVVLIPTLVLAGAGYARAQSTLRSQVVQQLESAAAVQNDTLAEWHASRMDRLESAASLTSLQQPAAVLMTATNLGAQSSLASQLSIVNSGAAESATFFSGLLVARRDGGLIVASDRPAWVGQTLGSDLGADAAATAFLAPDLPLDGAGDVALVSLLPLVTGDTEDLAILAGVTSGSRLASLLGSSRALYAEGSQAFLVTPEGLIVSLDPDTQQPLFARSTDHAVIKALPSANQGLLEYARADGTRVLGLYRWIEPWGAALTVEVPRSVAFASLNVLAPFMVVLVVLTAALVGILLPWVTRRSIAPLEILAESADRYASGEFGHRAQIPRQDEIGQLAATFNRMAEQLEEAYRSLEERVAARTRLIRNAAEIGREAGSILDVDSLLETVVRLISSRFGFYHASIFLIDDSGEHAVLKAASSEGGARMLQRGHKLAVGKMGIVGYVTGTGKPRIALDVGADAAHLVNPDLPATQSEMALPLRVGEQVIGALDVQSVEPDAFDEADVAAMQIMADQLAVAIQNTRLLEQQVLLASQRRKVIEIIHQLPRLGTYDRLRSEVASLVRETLGYACVILAQMEGPELVVRGVSGREGLELPPVGEPVPVGHGLLGRAVSGKTPTRSTGGQETRASLADLPTDPERQAAAVPLISRGQVTGAMAVEAPDAGPMTDEDVEMLELLATQIASSLDSARLFEEIEASLSQLDALYKRDAAEAWQSIIGGFGAPGLGPVVEYSGVGARPGDEDEQTKLEAAISMRGSPIGAIELEGLPTSEPVQEDEAILGAVAEEVANALEQARLVGEVRRRATQLQTAAEIAREATGLMDLGRLSSRAAALIKERFGFLEVSIFLSEEGGQAASLRATAGAAEASLRQRGLRIVPGDQSVVGLVLEKGEPVVIHDFTQEPALRPDPLLLEARSELGVPLVIGNRVIGALDVHHVQAHAFGEDDIAVLRSLADQMAVAIQNARLFAQTLRRAEREQALVRISGKIRASKEVDAMLRAAVTELRKTLSARQARIWLAQARSDLSDEGRTEQGRKPTP